MNVVVSDTNVFVALFKCDLLFKVFNDSRVNIVIPTKLYEELTLSAHRVSREYPALSQLITTLVFNAHHGHSISLTVFDHRQIDNTAAMSAHYYLEEQATLDRGEREAIPVTIHLSAIFVSCDAEAISEYDGLVERNGSSAYLFENYCENLKNDSVISQEDLQKILVAIRE